MATTAPPDAENVVIPPTVQINKMSDKLKAALQKGSVAAAKADEAKVAAPPAPTPAPAPEPAKAATPVPEPKPDAPKSIVPEPKPVEPAKATVEPPKTPQATVDPTKKIPAEQFKILEKQRDEARTNNETAQKKITELEAQLAQASKVDPKEIELLRKRAEDAEAIVNEFRVERSPQFKQAFTDQIARLKEEAKESVGSEHAEKAAKILKAPPSEWRDEQMEALGEELSGFKQGSLIRAYTELKRIEKDRDTQLANANQNVAKLDELKMQSERQAIIAQRQQTEMALANELVKFSVLPDFKPIEGNNDHNAIVAQNFATVKALVNSDLSPEERARMAVYAAKGIRSIETDMLKDAVIAKLEAQIAEMQAANPNLRPGKGAPAIPATTSGNQPETFATKFKKAMTEGIPPKE